MKYFFEELLEHIKIQKQLYPYSFDGITTNTLSEQKEDFPIVKGSFPHPYQYSKILVNFCEDYITNKLPSEKTDVYELYKIKVPNHIFDVVYDRWFNYCNIEICICFEKFLGAYEQHTNEEFYNTYSTEYLSIIFPKNNLSIVDETTGKSRMLPLLISCKCLDKSDNWKRILTEKLFHEMHHAYTDYKLELEGKDTFPIYQRKENYNEVINNINIEKSNSSIRYYAAKIAYCCFDLEINALISQIGIAYEKEYEEKIKSFDLSDINDNEILLKLIENSEVYNKLLESESLIRLLKSFTDEEKNKFLNEWNKLQEKHIHKSFHTLIDFIEYRYKKLYRKCINSISNIVNEMHKKSYLYNGVF